MPDAGSYFDKLTGRRSGGRGRRSGSAREPAGGNRTDGRLRDRVKDLARKVQRAGGAPTRVPTARPPSGAPGRGRRTSTATVTIEYAPSMDGDPDPGDVVWTWVPFEEDPTQGKDRPVVVIGRRGNQLAGIPLTTKRDDREVQVVVGTGDWDPDRRTSYARIWRLLEIDEHRMRREGAVLERDRFDEIIAAVDDYYEVVYAKRSDSDDLDRHD